MKKGFDDRRKGANITVKCQLVPDDGPSHKRIPLSAIKGGKMGMCMKLLGTMHSVRNLCRFEEALNDFEHQEPFSKA